MNNTDIDVTMKLFRTAGIPFTSKTVFNLDELEEQLSIETKDGLILFSTDGTLLNVILK